MDDDTKINLIQNDLIKKDKDINTDSDLDSDLDSDSDEYIDLSNYMENDLKHVFQFHLMNEKLLIKHIGKSSDTPDIIIMENFGPDSNMSLYNCVYSHDELESIKTDISNDDNIILTNGHKLENELEDNLEHLKLFFPIVKLIVKLNQDTNIIYCIAIKLNQEIVYEKEIKEWDLYWIEYSSSNKETFKTKKIEKDINPTNILEHLILYSLKNN